MSRFSHISIASSKTSPDEVLRAFVNARSSQNVNAMLWEVFRLAVLGGLKEHDAADFKGFVSAEEVASLFDQLIDLVQAVEVLHSSGGASSFSSGKEGSHD